MQNLFLNTCSGFGCHSSACKDLFVCEGCKVVQYCSSYCKDDGWEMHKGLCSYVQDLTKNFPRRGLTIKEKTRDEWMMSKLKFSSDDDQHFDPPSNCSYLNEFWKEREFVVNQKVVMKASIYPPEFKELIREGLKNKQISWEYLASDDFLPLAAHAKVPLDSLLALVKDVLLPIETKPDMCALIEEISDKFWRDRAVLPEVNQSDSGESGGSSSLFSPPIVQMLYRHNVRLPIQGRGEGWLTFFCSG